MSELIAGVSCYSSYLKISVRDGKKNLSYSRKIINFDDVMILQLIKMTERLGFSFKDIKTLCVVKGPGRFTAIRSIYTFASVYKAISGCRVFGVDVFDCLAYNLFTLDSSDKEVAVILHAFKDEYYLSFYSFRAKKIIREEKPQWLFFDDVLKKTKGFKGVIISDMEEFSKEMACFKDIKLAPASISKIIPQNIIDAALYFGSEDFEPFYLKPAKFEL
ncbi:MAG: hypothetical protein ACP5IO_05940 [Elusimicrobiales bacterium]